ncbi:alpha/beta fold hydrolase [Spirosoma taeanense]|uniref:Alpha/beta fold hydrolase n=1 Tax=Spirosoma taeanense TaxID=2735870 RepID=A0A6M5YDK9_9BACT|nr:alpha/beta fold hydrolase [Spirosoma taeanense]QJW91390.1 alpha/beta fold hydrolase [Spirosoma taeanense]
MPYLTTNGTELYYESTGTGPETIVFSHGLLWSGHMFHSQVAALRNRYRVITYDHRGQGRSRVTREGYDMDTVYEDVVGLIEQLGVGPCHFAGLSMGGFMGMRLAARRPDLIKSLTLLETSADPEPAENVPKYQRLCTVVKWLGTWPVVDPVMKIMFGKTFLTDPSRAAERQHWIDQLKQNKRTIVRAVQGAIDRKGVFDELKNITAPTLVIVGDEDVATVPAKAQRIHDNIAGSRLVIVPGAGHSSSVEQPEAVNEAITSFLKSINSSNR